MTTSRETQEAIFAAILAALAMYGLGAFSAATFDISQWEVSRRETVAALMCVAGIVTGLAVGLLRSKR